MSGKVWKQANYNGSGVFQGKPGINPFGNIHFLKTREMALLKPLSPYLFQFMIWAGRCNSYAFYAYRAAIFYQTFFQSDSNLSNAI